MNSAPFDPRQAADLLDQTTRQARRTFTALSPLLFMIRAVVALGVFGGFWLSVRGDHPYTGHISGWAIGLAVVLVLINIVWTAWAVERAGTGLCAVYLSIAAFTSWRQRRGMVRA